MPKYVLCWKYKDSDDQTIRTGSFADYHTIKSWVETMNRQYPNIHHWMEIRE